MLPLAQVKERKSRTRAAESCSIYRQTLTHHVNILEINGDSYRLGQSRARKAEAST